jgi:hypothetical protein
MRKGRVGFAVQCNDPSRLNWLQFRGELFEVLFSQRKVIMGNGIFSPEGNCRRVQEGLVKFPKADFPASDELLDRIRAASPPYFSASTHLDINIQPPLNQPLQTSNSVSSSWHNVPAALQIRATPYREN